MWTMQWTPLATLSGHPSENARTKMLEISTESPHLAARLHFPPVGASRRVLGL